MTNPTAAPAAVPAPSPNATRDEGRSPTSPLSLRPTPSQLARAERATAHSGVAAHGWRLRWSDEAAPGEGADPLASPGPEG